MIKPISNIINKIIGGETANLVTSVGNVVDKFVTSGDEKLAAKAEIEKLISSHNLKVLELAEQGDAAALKDIQSAREMQIAALGQEDRFAKRYVYYLATFVILMVMTFDTLMFFVNYPEHNRDMINQVSGILNATALVMVLSFFFGSSKSSHDKTNMMDKALASSK